MIKLFVSDIDGCLAEPYRPFDRQRFEELADYVGAAGRLGHDDARPAFSICSGRAFAYVEAMTQMLGVQVPVLFEAGGGLYDPLTAQITWHPNFTQEIEEAIEAVRRWMIGACLPGTSLMYDYGKRTQAGVAGPDHDEVAAYGAVVERHVARHFPALRVFLTSISIDVLAANVTKRQGLGWLAGRLGCPMDQIAYIGDTTGDLGALDAVGYSFAPANAVPAVRERVQQVTEGRLIDGVLEAYRWCLAHNRTQQKKAS